MERGLFAIHCLDDLSGEMIERENRFGGSAKRLAHYAEHKSYVAQCNDPSSSSYIKKICGGPLESDDQKFMIGSFFIVEGSKDEVERFHRNDPFYINGIWGKVTITRYVSPSGIKAVEAVIDDADPKTLRMVVK